MVTRIVVDPATPSTIYAGLVAAADNVAAPDDVAAPDAVGAPGAGPAAEGGIVKSIDGGTSFAPAGLSGHSIYSLLVAPNDSRLVLVGTPDGFFHSSDGGATWLEGDAGNGGATFADLMIDAEPARLYGATDKGLSVSTDGGTTWRHAGLVEPAIALMPDPFAPGSIYAATLPLGAPVKLGDEARVNPRRRVSDVINGLMLSSDGGHAWDPADNGLLGQYLDYHLAVDFQTPALYAGTYDGLFRSTTPSALWRPTGLLETTITALAVAPSAPATLYAGVEPTADAFVARLAPDGSSLLYSSFMGGSNHDAGLAIAVDGVGNAYVTGGTQSTDFPATRDALQLSNNGGRDDPYSGDGFMIKVGPAGDLLYATYFGGKQAEAGTAIGFDPGGNVVISGQTSSTDFPNLYPSLTMGVSPFILKFSR
jgi:hypothetical protein